MDPHKQNLILVKPKFISWITKVRAIPCRALAL